MNKLKAISKSPKGFTPQDVNGIKYLTGKKTPVEQVSRKLFEELSNRKIKRAYFDFSELDEHLNAYGDGVVVALIGDYDNTPYKIRGGIHIYNTNELKMSNVHKDILKQVDAAIKRVGDKF